MSTLGTVICAVGYPADDLGAQRSVFKVVTVITGEKQYEQALRWCSEHRLRDVAPDIAAGEWEIQGRVPVDPETQGLNVGDRVRIVKSNAGLVSQLGTITQVVPESGGYLVRPDGHDRSYGWGYGEVEVLEPKPPPPALPRTCWERLT